MPLTIDASVGGVAANSYNTVLEGDEYFAGRPGSESWTGQADAEKKMAALIAGTNRLDQEQFAGYKTSTAQRLKHPRVGLEDDDGYPYPSDAIVRAVKEAALELALSLLQNAKSLGRSTLLQFEQLQVGSISITPSRQGLNPDALPPQVVRLLRGIRTSMSGQSEVVQG